MWIKSPGRVAFLALAVAAGVVVGGLRAGWIALPERFNPWAELDPMATPNLLTPMKLRRARDDPARCRTALTALGAAFQPVPDQAAGPGCDVRDGVRLSGLRGARLASPALLSCRGALSLAMWEHHALQPAAQARLQSPIASVQHLGSYACRNVNTGEPGVPGARRSRHATADAIDIAGFTTADGRRLTVLRDWRAAAPASEGERAAPSSPEAAFLDAAHAGACRFFDGVLGPAYNAVHADHFHLEDGGWRTCR